MTLKGLIGLAVIVAVATWSVFRRKSFGKDPDSPRVDPGDPTGHGNVGMWSGGDGDGGIGGSGES